MKGPEELNSQIYGNRNEINKNHPAPYETDSYSSFDREFCSYSSFENHSCWNLRYSHFSPTPFHSTELKTKKLEVALQRIQEQLQLNLLKQALIIQQQKFDKTNSPSKQWKSHYFDKADGDWQGLFCKEIQSRIIKRECDICDEGLGDSSNSESDCKFLKVIDRVQHSNFSNIKQVVKEVNATDEEKNLRNDILKSTATPPFNIDELDLNNSSSMCCQNSAERNSYLSSRRNFSHSHVLKNIPVRNENVKNPNSASHMIADDKFSTMQLQQQLGMQQQELIQQLQLVQRQYLMHQEMLSQEAQHSPALIFPSYVRTPLQPFEYRSKDNHGLSSTVHLKGTAGNLVPSQDLSKQDQADQQPDNIEVSRNDTCNDLESPEAETEKCFTHASQTRTKYKNQSLPFSPASKEPLNGANADNSKASEPHSMHSEYSKGEHLKEPLNNNLTDIRDLYSNEQSDDEGHSQNLVCSNSPSAEGGNHNYQPLNEKCDRANRNDLEISPRPCNVLNDSLNDAMSNDQQSSFGANFDEFMNAEKYYHHLFAHGMCRWPGCDLILDDVSAFMKCFRPGDW